MQDYDRKHKWMRLVLDHETLEPNFFWWVQNQDGSYKSILKTQGSKEETTFANESFFRQQVFQFLHTLALDDDPQHSLQIDAKSSPSVLIRVNKLHDPIRRSHVQQQIKKFFSENKA